MKQNFWRVRHVLGDQEDAMSECAVQWCECRKRYGAHVDNPAWFMHLYKMCVMSRFTDLANKNTRRIDVVTACDMGESQFDGLPDSQALEQLDLSIKLQTVSSELKEVLTILFNAPREAFDGLFSPAANPQQVFAAIANKCGISKSNVLLDELREVLS